MRSSNPALNSKTFQFEGPVTEKMTIQGTVNKTLIMLLLVVFSASKTWSMFISGSPSVSLLMYGGFIGGLIFAFITIFKKTWSPYTAPIYALLEGLALGGISAYFELAYPGIVIDAVVLTFGTLFVLLMAYKSGVIKATENFIKYACIITIPINSTHLNTSLILILKLNILYAKYICVPAIKI